MVSMSTISRYWCPSSIDQALLLLERPGAVLIGGGTQRANLAAGHGIEVVDLQAVGLGGIARAIDGPLVIGATTSLQDISDDPTVPDVIRDAARRELPSSLRTQATLGGRIAHSEYDSELVASLLVFDARVRVARRDGETEHTLTELLAAGGARRGEILTAVTIETSGRAASARTGRTRADQPIVAAVARDDGDRRWLALAGVAATPVLLDLSPAAETQRAQGVEDRGAALIDDQLAALDYPGDFRGSSEYRRALARTLSRRAMEEVSR